MCRIYRQVFGEYIFAEHTFANLLICKFSNCHVVHAYGTSSYGQLRRPNQWQRNGRHGMYMARWNSTLRSISIRYQEGINGKGTLKSNNAIGNQQDGPLIRLPIHHIYV